jgi:GxxExxY protein
MDANEDKIVYRELSFKIVGLAMEVHNSLGYGFLEKVYENALMVLFRRENIPAMQQASIKVRFEGIIVGDYIADMLVDNKILIELKAVDKIIDIHRAQALNYLKATGLKLCIILNFGKLKLEQERIVL